MCRYDALFQWFKVFLKVRSFILKARVIQVQIFFCMREALLTQGDPFTKLLIAQALVINVLEPKTCCAKPTMSSTSVCHKFYVYVIVSCLSNNIFVGTKIAMLFSIQVFTKLVITWASVVNLLQPKTHSKANDKL